MNFVKLLFVFILFVCVEGLKIKKTNKQDQDIIVSKTFDPKEAMQGPTAIVETVKLDKEGNEIQQPLEAY